MTIQQLMSGGLLIALGYLMGQDGEQRLVVAETEADGKTPRLPALNGPGTPSIGGKPITGLYTPPTVSGGWRLKKDVFRLGADIFPDTASTTYYLSALVDAEEIVSILIVLDSTCDQDLTVQAVGHTSDDPKSDALANIEASQTLAAGSSAHSRLTLGIDLDINWHPYLGVTIASGTSPATTGRVQAWAYVRRWVREGQV